jgi:hypothetical protein
MKQDGVINWLLSGDVSIQYQVYRDLLDSDRKQFRDRISTEGWGAKFLQKRNKEGHWGRGFYQPKAEDKSRTFLLQNKLFRSDRTGNIIDKKMLMLSYPSRWRYDILRALDYFRLAGVEYDSRMDDAIDVLLKKKRADSKWPLQARHSGQTHFYMEKTGKPSRCNTLRALRVLKYFEVNDCG